MKTAQSATDLVRTYLREIGRVPLLTHEEEIFYGKQVQRSTALHEIREGLATRLGHEPSVEEWATAADIEVSELNQAIAVGEIARTSTLTRVLIAIPIVLAIGFGLILPNQLRRRRKTLTV